MFEVLSVFLLLRAFVFCITFIYLFSVWGDVGMPQCIHGGHTIRRKIKIINRRNLKKTQLSVVQ
jgi:hypothetical protein